MGEGSHSACQNRADKMLWSLGLPGMTGQGVRGLGFPSHLQLLQLLPSHSKKIVRPKVTWEKDLAGLSGGPQRSACHGACVENL